MLFITAWRTAEAPAFSLTLSLSGARIIHAVPLTLSLSTARIIHAVPLTSHYTAVHAWGTTSQQPLFASLYFSFQQPVHFKFYSSQSVLYDVHYKVFYTMCTIKCFV